MVCGGKGGNHPTSNCQSDSGGPLMCQNLFGTWSLEGVVSFGHSMCQPGYYSAYARVSRYRNWIRQHTGKLSKFQILPSYMGKILRLSANA